MVRLNWIFWRKKKKCVPTEEVEKPFYDEELEVFLQQSQVFPYLQAGLEMINQIIDGEIGFYSDTHIEQKSDIGEIDLWHITKHSIRLAVYNESYDKILYVDTSLYGSFKLSLKLPMENGILESLFIEKTRIYEEYKKKMVRLYEISSSEDEKEERTKRLLQSDAQKHRLANLLK